MYAVIIMMLIVTCVCISITGFPKFKKKMNRKTKNSLEELRAIAMRSGLSLTAEEAWRYGAIGIGGIEKKLLYLDKFNDDARQHIINLTDIENCTINVVFRNIDAGDLEYKSVDEFIKTMVLHIEHRNRRQSFDIHFYNSRFDWSTDLPELRSKAYRWKKILSQLQEKKYMNHAQ